MANLNHPVPCSGDILRDSKYLLCRDYSSILQWCIDKIPKLTSDWTDFTITDPGVLLLSGISYVFDYLHYTLDNKYFNNILKYSTSYNSLLCMCNLLGVEMDGMTSSTCIFLVENHTNHDFVMKKGCVLKVLDEKTNKSLYFNLYDDFVIQPGVNTVIGIEGSLKTLKNQNTHQIFSSGNEFLILDNDVGLNTIIMLDSNGNTIRKVKDALLIYDDIPSYSVHLGKDHKTIIRISPGFKYSVGLCDIMYAISNGGNGNSSSDSASLISMENEVYFTSGDKVKDIDYSISIATCSGGRNYMSTDEMRELIGRESGRIDTLVTNNDYLQISDDLDCIYNIVMDNDPSGLINIYYTGIESKSSEEIESELQEYLSDKMMLGLVYQLHPVNEYATDMYIDVYLNRNVIAIRQIEDKFIDYLKTTFSRANQIPGTRIVKVKLAIDLASLDETIAYVRITNLERDIELAWNEILKINHIEVNFKKGK